MLTDRLVKLFLRTIAVLLAVLVVETALRSPAPAQAPQALSSQQLIRQAQAQQAGSVASKGAGWKKVQVQGQEAGTTTARFVWRGQFYNPPYQDWAVDSSIEATVDAVLEQEDQWPDGTWDRYYSVSDVTVTLWVSYKTYVYSRPEWRVVTESYRLVLGARDFDLSFDPDGYLEFGSMIQEYERPIDPLDYPELEHCWEIQLTPNGQKILRTPKGAILSFSNASFYSSIGCFWLIHHLYPPDSSNSGDWPLDATFTSPPGCGYSPSLHWMTETSSLYQRLKFLDETTGDYLTGAVADGASRVVVEIPDVTNSADLSIPTGDGTLVSGPTIQDGVWRWIWQAPADFGSDGGTSDRRTIGFVAIVDGETLDSPPFFLYRTPVVLLHGLWSDGTVWRKLTEELENQGFHSSFITNYPYPNESSFSANRFVVPSRIQRVLDCARLERVKATKVDIVGHSMGGCLAKLYGLKEKERIRRIVTIGTPHYGSPVANAVLSPPQDIYIRAALLRLTGRDLFGGAVHDLREGFCQIPGNLVPVPALAIRGIAGSSELPVVGPLIEPLAAALWSLQGLLVVPMVTHAFHESLFRGDKSDWIVSSLSQQGGNQNRKQDISGPWHCDEPSNGEVINAVISFLNEPTGPSGLTISDLAEREDPLHPPKRIPESLRFADALTSGGIEIATPAAGAIYAPGTAVRVAVSAPAGTSRVLMAMSDGPTTLTSAPPFQADLLVPVTAAGTVAIVAIACNQSGPFGFTSTSINVETTATIGSLITCPDSVMYLRTGDTVPLTVHGVYSDGVERDVTRNPGTSYSTTNAQVATVAEGGLLTARGVGFCFVNISNGASLDIPLFVDTPLLPTPATGVEDWTIYSQMDSKEKSLLVSMKRE